MHTSLKNGFRSLVVVLLLAAPALLAQPVSINLQADPFFHGFFPVAPPESGPLIFKPGDRLAICGDSITEQKMYSRFLETYLTVCAPELQITVRQYGWSGETAEGFYHRMTNDCLRFDPTVATTCYGMNDHHYRTFDEGIAKWYRENSEGIVKSFKGRGVRVIVGSPSCIGKMPPWADKQYSVRDMNLTLCAFRNFDAGLANEQQVRFADVFWPMFVGGFEARKKYGENYGIAGGDGVHPGWAGHVFMARAFLKAMGLDGRIGTFTVDLKSGVASATEGHSVTGFKDGVLSVTSRRYPFCATGNVYSDNSIRSGMALSGFNDELNRLILVVKGTSAANYKVTWGGQSRVYPAAQLEKGVNLADDFEVNPFSEAFNQVDRAVIAKQNYETHQIKDLFHGAEGAADMEATVKKSEAERAPLARAVATAFVPVSHQIKIEAQ